MEQEGFKQLSLHKFKLISKLKLMNVFPGEWESIYKGEGIEFDSTRPFESGDSLKDLDLFALARTGEEEIVLRAEERQMKVFIWADLSGSMQRSGEMFFRSKAEIRDIAIGLIAYSACNSYAPLGLCAFDNDVRHFFAARVGLDYCDEIINWVIDQDSKNTTAPADIKNATSFLLERASLQDMIFFISDFKGQIFEGNFTSLIKPLIRKFDFIPVVIRDPLEKGGSIKRPVSIVLENNEGKGSAEFYLTPKKMKKIQEVSAGHLFNLKWNFHQVGIECIVLDSVSIDDCFQSFSNFFEARKRIRV